jgi:ribosomal-protein-alanine N-acetyltransferase
LLARDGRTGHIGNMSAHVDERHRVADVSILVGERSVWGQGYGTEAFRAVCGYLLHQAGMRKVTAGTLSVNRGMLAIMRHLGMVEDGRRVRQCLFEGAEVDVIHGALFR